ncbi:MAG: Acetate permease ActP (cation/acetate symporter), partial [uncultured Solirubrobacteraceae bacterium]
DLRPGGRQHRGAGHLRHRPRRHPGHHVLGLAAHDERDAVLGGGPRHHGPAERLRHRGGLHVRRVLPGHRRPDLPLRLRRVPLLRRLPRGLPHGAVPARRADAQRGQVHHRRRPGLPAAGAARPRGGRHGDARGGGVLPHRADGRRGRAHHRARGHRLQPGDPPDGDLHAHLRHLRRDARHDVGADRQGRAAHGRRDDHVDLRPEPRRLQPGRAVPRRPRRLPRGAGLPRAGALPGQPDRHPLPRPGARARHGRPAAHPHALLHGARRQGGAVLRGLGGRPDRRLLHHDHVPGLRRPGDPRRGGRGGRRRRREPRGAEPRAGARRRRRDGRRRRLPGGHRGDRLRHHPRGGRGPGHLRLRRGGPRPVVQRHPQGPRLRARGGPRRADRRGRHRRHRDPHRDHRRQDPERLVHGRPRLRGGGERELPGAPARAHVAALQHHGRGGRRAHRRDLRDRAGDHLAEGLARARQRGRPARVLRPGQPRDRVHPARLPGLLAGDAPVLEEGDGGDHGARVPRALRAVGDRPRRREGPGRTL